MCIGLGLSQKQGQDQSFRTRLLQELEINHKRLEVELEAVLNYGGEYELNIGEPFDYPEFDSEIRAFIERVEELKNRLDKRVCIIPDEGYVTVRSIHPFLVFDISWPRTHGENDDGTFDEGAFYEGIKSPPREKISLSRIIY